MFDLPKQYEVNKKIPMKNLVLNDFKSADKKKIRDNIKKVVLTHQIVGDEIPTMVNENYHYEVIQFFDFELVDIKKADSIARLYQELFRSACVIRCYTKNEENYSFALKRLNQTDQSQIVVTDSFSSEIFHVDLISTQKKEFSKVVRFPSLVNRINKYSLYMELYAKAYLATNEKMYHKGVELLAKPIWYDTTKVISFYSLLRSLVTKKKQVEMAVTNVEKVKLNKEIREILIELGVIMEENKNGIQ